MGCHSFCDRFKNKKPFNRAYKDGFFYCAKCEYHEKIELLDGSNRCQCCHYKVRLKKKRKDQHRVVGRY